MDPAISAGAPSHEYVRSLERYAAYVGANLERIQSDGFVPLCFDEFVESEENSDDYYGVGDEEKNHRMEQE